MHTPMSLANPLGSDAAHSADMLQFLRFALGDGIYAVPIDAVREILEVAATTPLPLMPTFVRGVMNLRGAVVPVIDLAARLGLPPAVPGRRTCIVVVEVHPLDEQGGATQVLGLMVDAVHEVLDAEPGSLEEAPVLGTRIEQRFISGIARARHDMVTVLDLPRSLESDELARLIGQAVQH